MTEHLEISLEKKGNHDLISSRRSLTEDDIKKIKTYVDKKWSRSIIILDNYEFKRLRQELVTKNREIDELKTKVKLIDEGDLINKVKKLKQQLKNRLYVSLSDVPSKYDAEGHKICLSCNSLLEGQQQKYCCEACSIKAARLLMWSSIVADIFERDNYTCLNCGYKTTIYSDCFGQEHKIVDQLECDHIIPVALGGDPLDKSNMQTLCKKCHREKTKKDIEKIKLFYAGL